MRVVLSGPLSTDNWFSISVERDYGAKEIERIIRHLEIDRANLMQDSETESQKEIKLEQGSNQSRS